VKGAFFGDWLGIAVVLFIIAWIGLKFGSVYLDHYGARSQIEELQSTRGDQAETAEEVRQRLAKRLQINNLKGMLDSDQITVVERGSRVVIVMNYEVKTTLAGNMSVLIEFDEQFEIGSDGGD
jgi:adenylate kinase